MKIAMLTTWFPPIIVGSGNRFYEVGKRLSKRHEVHVYACGISNCEKEEEMDGIYVHRYGTFDPSRSIEKESALLNLKFSLHLLKSTHKLKDFDIIDCNIVSKTLPYVSYFISRSIKTPLIETWHEVWHKENLNRYNLLIALPGFLMESFMPKLSDFNIAVSETTKRRLIDLLKIKPESIAVISNGVDLKKISKVSAEKEYGRILYAGRLESHKRVDVLIRSYKKLKKEFSEIELIIVGTGSQKSYLQELSSKLNDVKFYDPLPYERLMELMKSSWIFVLPSIMEGQGIVLLETMAAGTPSIATRAEGSGVVDVVMNNFNGLLVSEDEIEYAIRRLLLDEELHRRLSRNGMRHVKKYSWDETARRTERVYEIVTNINQSYIA